ncbi:SseB protein N-terminal domain [Prauserella sp. Am3]|nr:SseB protein N-terminal domain [Prauserella sp. Am3]
MSPRSITPRPRPIAGSWDKVGHGPRTATVVAVTNPQLPPVVYLPTGPHHGTATEQADIELRRTPDGRLALLAYSAVDRLVECCGPHQPWMLVQTSDLPALHESQPYELILLDAEIPEELRRTA